MVLWRFGCLFGYMCNKGESKETMRYKLKYQTRGKVETYIAMATATISVLAEELYADRERLSILQNIADEVMAQAESSKKGLTAAPECEIEGEANPALLVRNTLGREVLMVYFDWIYENNERPQITYRGK